VQVHQFRAFLVLAEELNYHRAAERLSLSQPGLSDQIRGLERYLRVKLFVRGRKGTRLTATGAQLIPLADAAVQAIDDFATAAGGGHVPVGSNWPRRFRIGLLADGLGEMTWQLLRMFNEARPDVEIAVKPLSFMAAFQAVDFGLVDAVLCTGPAARTERQQVTSLGCEPIAALLTRSNYLAEHEHVDLELVARKLTFDTPSGLDSVFRDFWLQLGLRDRAGGRVSNLVQMQDAPLIVDAVATRFGRLGAVGFWPARFRVDEARTGCVVRSLDQPFHAPRQILSDRRNDHSAALLNLVESMGVTTLCPTGTCSFV